MSEKTESSPEAKAMIEKLRSSENLQLSPVSFLIQNVSGLLEGVMSPDAFARETIVATKNAQFYFKHMPQELRVKNIDVFDREFSLADKINEYITAYMKMGDEDRCGAESFNDAILAFVKEYIS